MKPVIGNHRVEASSRCLAWSAGVVGRVPIGPRRAGRRPPAFPKTPPPTPWRGMPSHTHGDLRFRYSAETAVFVKGRGGQGRGRRDGETALGERVS